MEGFQLRSTATVKVSGVPSFVTQDDFARLFAVEGCVEAQLMGRQPGGDQLGYASFQDIKSAENSITFYQGYQGLGGRGLQCELLPPNQGAGGSAGHKRLREDDAAQQAASKQARGDILDMMPPPPPPPPQAPAPFQDVQALLQGLDSGVLAGLLQAAHQQTHTQPAAQNPPQNPQLSPLPQRYTQQGYGQQQQTGGTAYQPQYAPAQPEQTLAPRQELDHLQSGRTAGAYMPQPAPQQQQQTPPAQGAYPPQTYQQQAYQPPGAQPQSYQAALPPQQQAYQPLQAQPLQQPPPQQQQYYQPQATIPQPAAYGAPIAPAQQYTQQYPQHPPTLQPPPHLGGQGTPAPHPTPLPPDACSTLYLEGLPPNVTKRELGHLFRPFQGYTGLRLVIKDSKKYTGEKLVMAFVEFDSVAAAAEGMARIEAYVFDPDYPDAPPLKVKYARPMENPRAAMASAAAKGNVTGRGHPAAGADRPPRQGGPGGGPDGYRPEGYRPDGHRPDGYKPTRRGGGSRGEGPPPPRWDDRR